MYLINEVEFIEINEQEVLIVNLINGAADIIGKDIHAELVAKDFEKIDAEIKLKMIERKYIFPNKLAYKKFINAVNKKIEKLEKKSIPNFLIVTTYACNLNCIYCYEQTYMIRGTTKKDPFTMIDLQFAKIDDIMVKYEKDYSKKQTAVRITIMGGEPLLKNSLNIIEYIFQNAEKRNYSVDIVTNGVDVENYLTLFSKYKNTLEHVQITVDGIKEIHDKRRVFHGGKGSFDIIMKNVTALLAAQIKVYLRVNVDKTNIEQLPELANFLVKKYQNNQLLKPYLYLLQDGGCSGEANVINESIGIERLFELEDKHENMKKLAKKFHGIDFVNCIFENKPYQPVLRHCGASKNQYILDCKSNIYRCWHGIGNDFYRVGVFEPKYVIDEKKDSEWQNRSVQHLKKCQKCKYRYICGTGCPAARHLGSEEMNVLEASCVDYESVLQTLIKQKIARL